MGSYTLFFWSNILGAAVFLGAGLYVIHRWKAFRELSFRVGLVTFVLASGIQAVLGSVAALSNDASMAFDLYGASVFFLLLQPAALMYFVAPLVPSGTPPNRWTGFARRLPILFTGVAFGVLLAFLYEPSWIVKQVQPGPYGAAVSWGPMAPFMHLFQFGGTALGLMLLGRSLMAVSEQSTDRRPLAGVFAVLWFAAVYPLASNFGLHVKFWDSAGAIERVGGQGAWFFYVGIYLFALALAAAALLVWSKPQTRSLGFLAAVGWPATALFVLGALPYEWVAALVSPGLGRLVAAGFLVAVARSPAFLPQDEASRPSSDGLRRTVGAAGIQAANVVAPAGFVVMAGLFLIGQPDSAFVGTLAIAFVGGVLVGLPLALLVLRGVPIVTVGLSTFHSTPGHTVIQRG